MKNKMAGTIIIVISLLIGVLIYLFNKALKEIINQSCDHGPTCPMWTSVKFQTNIGILVLVVVLAAGTYLIFSKELNRETKKEHKINLSKFEPDERKVLQKIIEEQGSIFQSKLTEDTGLNKVKITRILDRLEGKGTIERKRRGMTNVVILKQH